MTVIQILVYLRNKSKQQNIKNFNHGKVEEELRIKTGGNINSYLVQDCGSHRMFEIHSYKRLPFEDIIEIFKSNGVDSLNISRVKREYLYHLIENETINLIEEELI